MLMEPWVVGVDLGGTTIKLGLIDPQNKVLERRKIPTNPEEGPEAAVERMATVVGEFRSLLSDDQKIAALGIVYYEMVIERKTFTADTPMAVLFKHASKPLPRQVGFIPSLPEAIEKVLIRALAKQPEDHQSMGEFSGALEKRLGGQAVSSAPVERPAPVKSQETRASREQEGGESTRLQEATRDELASPAPAVQPAPVPPHPTAGKPRSPISRLPSFLPWVLLGILVVALLVTLGIRSTGTRPADGMVMLYVPAGNFTMGSSEGTGYDDDQPPHTVYLDAFWIDKTDVTNAMFQKFVNAAGYVTDAEKAGKSYVFNINNGNWELVNGADWLHPQGSASSLAGLEDHPVVQVSWYDARAYCKWAGVQLPSEAQWEKAALGTDGRTYPWGDQNPSGNLANFADVNLNVSWADKNTNDGYQFTSPVGFYPKGSSPYGALDMAGNVWQWVNDWYDAHYYASSPASNPQGPSSGTYRVLRGGSWFEFSYSFRSALRLRFVPSLASYFLGFRCARSFH